MSEHKVIKFPKPIKAEYSANRDDNGKLTCPPIKMGRGCYGDCYDCYSIHQKWYNNVKEILSSNKVSIPTI